VSVTVPPCHLKDKYVTCFFVLTRKGEVGMNKMTSLSGDIFQPASSGKRRIANHLVYRVLIDID